jgi:hypothetical protein
MKKLFLLFFALGAVVTLSACGTDLTQDDIQAELLSSEESLATLSYLSAGFLDFETPTVSDTTSFMFLSDGNGNSNGAATKFEDEADIINVYFDRLKAMIDNGVDSFGSVTEEASDNELYDFKLTFTVDEEVYVIYYSIDEVTAEMTGIIIVGDLTFDFEVIDNMKEYEYQQGEKPEDDENEVDQDSTDDDVDQEEEDDELDDNSEDDDADTEEETKMVLVATNGEDSIRIMYKTETSDDEEEVKFSIEKTIAGVTTYATLKIEQEEDEYKITVSEDGDTYTFKREVEDDNEVVYKLQYHIDGINGMVKITEITDEEGNVTYSYLIVEGGKTAEIERGEPKSHGFDDDIDEDDEESEESDDNESSTDA